MRSLLKPLLLGMFCVVAVGTAFAFGYWWSESSRPLSLPEVLTLPQESEKPYQQYSFDALRDYPFTASEITLLSVLERGEDFTGYQFEFKTMGKRMTGQINIPASAVTAIEPFPVIIMNRGWAPQATYISGTGTRPAARVFARNGYITIAPDFFGYGDSDPEPEDAWEARFIKPISVIELLQTVRTAPQLKISDSSEELPSDVLSIRLDSNRVAFWGHSNGGHITISVLEILREPIPATVWAPVTAPFPYSLLFFTDEDPDEGKGFRKWLADFEAEYDVYDFSITKHVDDLLGPLQIQHGTADDAALIAWSDAFAELVALENDRRAAIREEISSAKTATEAAALEATVSDLRFLDPIRFSYSRYPGANHNMVPNWDEAVAADLTFFESTLSNTQ